MQKKLNSIANAMKLHLFCLKPSKYSVDCAFPTAFLYNHLFTPHKNVASICFQRVVLIGQSGIIMMHIMDAYLPAHMNTTGGNKIEIDTQASITIDSWG